MNKKSFESRYLRICRLISVVCSVLVVANFLITDICTGDKAFSEFEPRDWNIFIAFLCEEFLLLSASVICAIVCGRITKKRNRAIDAAWERNKFEGISPTDYDYVWFNSFRDERALITKKDGKYALRLDMYDPETEKWKDDKEMRLFPSLQDVKKYLFYDCDFYCDANTEIDKHGNEIYKGK